MRPRPCTARSCLASAALLVTCAAGAPGLAAAVPVSATTGESPGQALDRIKREAGAIPNQALALARAAWIDTPRDPQVAALARSELVAFGDKGFDALRWAVRHAAPPLQADVVAALLESRRATRGQLSADYAPAIEAALWFGAREAKRLALPELAEMRYHVGALTIVDAAVEHPELTLDALRALGALGNDRMRSFLVDVLGRGTPRERRAAANAMARIGNRALRDLREATRSDDPRARAAAMAELLPISTLDDVSVLHEFVARHGGADESLVAAVRGRAEQLELLIELEDQRETFGPPPDAD